MNSPEYIRDGVVRFDVDGRRLTFRIPDIEDTAALDEHLPLLPVDEQVEGDAENDPLAALGEILSDPGQTQRFMHRANRLLVATCLEPRLTEAFPAEPEKGALPVRSIKSGERIHMFLCLLGMAGFNREATAQLVPFAATSSSSSAATASPGGTEAGPTNSSAPETEADGTPISG